MKKSDLKRLQDTLDEFAQFFYDKNRKNLADKLDKLSNQMVVDNIQYLFEDDTEVKPAESPKKEHKKKEKPE